MPRKVTVRRRRRDGVRQRYHYNVRGRLETGGDKRKLKLVIGGPPHSGKSTFMTLLHRDLRDKGVDAKLLDLDYASPTIAYLLGKSRGGKQPWSNKLALQAKQDFNVTSKKHDLTLGDAPGKITDVTKIISRGCDGAIILSRDRNETGKWKRFFKSIDVPVLAVVDSRLRGVDIYSHKYDRGRVTKLSREDLRAGKIDDDNIVIESITHEIGDRLGIDLLTERR